MDGQFVSVNNPHPAPLPLNYTHAQGFTGGFSGGPNYDYPTQGSFATSSETDPLPLPFPEIEFDERGMPVLDDQLSLLGLEDSDNEIEDTGKLVDQEIQSAVIFSAQLFEHEERAAILIPQFGLLGSLRGSRLEDGRIFLNSNVPTSFFVCGLQGSGKSHTLSTLLGE